MLYPPRSAQDPYCIRTVSVDFRSDPSKSAAKFSSFTYAADAADEVVPYWLRTLSVLPPPASVYSVHGVRTLSADQINVQMSAESA